MVTLDYVTPLTYLPTCAHLPTHLPVRTFLLLKRLSSLVQEVMLRSADYLRRIIARGARRSRNVLLVPALQQFPIGRLRLVGLWEKTHQVVVRNL